MVAATLRIVETVDLARTTVLMRRAPEAATLPEVVRRRLAEVFGKDLTAQQAVDTIIQRVRTEGDDGLRDLTRLFDGSVPDVIQVSRREISDAYDRVDSALVASLTAAAERIRSFHAKQPARSWFDFDNGGTLGQIVRPLDRVGIYSPKGSAGYPSTLLMVAIPARVAGVGEIVVAAPPFADGNPSASTLVAADIAGVDRVLRIGGAQAIAAMAYGTKSVPRVDKILGPGNIFVTLAKRQVSGDVAIDQLAGPTETVVIADDSANPAWVAADLLAQAEHDPMATAILLATTLPVATSIAAEVTRQSELLSRADIIAASLSQNGGAVVCGSLDAAVELANEYAPEHLCLAVRDPWSVVPLVRNAGGVFVGEKSLEAVGDYAAGPSHVMPTGGTARFSSPVNVWDFIKITSLFALSADQIREIGPTGIRLAEAEGFTAHAEAIRHRLGKD